MAAPPDTGTAPLDQGGTSSLAGPSLPPRPPLHPARAGAVTGTSRIALAVGTALALLAVVGGGLVLWMRRHGGLKGRPVLRRPIAAKP